MTKLLHTLATTNQYIEIHGSDSVLKVIKTYLLATIIFFFPIGYLSIKHSIHYALFIILLISLIDWKNWNAKKSYIIIWLIISLSSLSFSGVLTQLAHKEFYMPAFDGYIRILLSGIALIYLIKQPLNIINLILTSIPIALTLLLVNIVIHPEINTAWGGRFATNFVDPNSLGSQCIILTSISLFTIKSHEKKMMLMLKIVGVISGLYISIFSGSRGGWVGGIFLFFIWFYLFASAHQSMSRTRKFTFLASTIIFLILIIFLIELYQPVFSDRFFSTVRQVREWFTGKDSDTSAGIRMSLWFSIFQLIESNIWTGLGFYKYDYLVRSLAQDISISKATLDTLLASGAHSDLLKVSLHMGVIGLISYLLTLFVPAVIFWKNRHNLNTNIKAASHSGLYLITGFFICGLFNEMLSLKYMCSFFGLMNACLIAQIYKEYKC